jgi:hypothetical protein
LLLQESKDLESIEKLGKVVSISTMKTFTVSYDRHSGKYGFKESDFPEKYQFGTSVMEYSRDPDYTNKMECQRVNF